MKKLLIVFISMFFCNNPVTIEQNNNSVQAVIEIESELGTPLEIHQHGIKLTYVPIRSTKTLLLDEGKAVGASRYGAGPEMDSVTFTVINNKKYKARRISGGLTISGVQLVENLQGNK